MKIAMHRIIPALQLLALAALIAMAISGCQSRADKRAEHQRQVAQAERAMRHIVPAIRPITDDIDRQLGRATGFGIAASGLSAAGLVFVIFEASAFLRIALAIFASCLLSTVTMFALRLSVPLLAIALPWFMGACLIAGLIAAWLWYRHNGPVKLKNPLRPKVPVPPVAPPPSPIPFHAPE